MLSEVTCKSHPCHVAGNGAEQDYSSPLFAARRESPWYQIRVAWNYQLHQSLRRRDRTFRMRAKSGVVHFSGEVKMWHRISAATSSESEDRRREVSHSFAATNGEDGGSGDVAFAGRLMSYQRGHALCGCPRQRSLKTIRIMVADVKGKGYCLQARRTSLML